VKNPISNFGSAAALILFRFQDINTEGIFLQSAGAATEYMAAESPFL
jgi:hypothetical protein